MISSGTGNEGRHRFLTAHFTIQVIDIIQVSLLNAWHLYLCEKIARKDKEDESSMQERKLQALLQPYRRKALPSRR